MTRSARTLFLLCTVAIAGVSAPLASAQSFTDVKSGDFGYEAVEYLKNEGILGGYADGTFKPQKPVNRAEAAKIMAAPFMTDAEQKRIGKTEYTDITAGAWFIPYVEWGRLQLKIFDGPPTTTTFKPESGITKAAFLKMMFLSYDVDPNSFSEVKLQLSPDTDPGAWYYPYLRYAVASSVVLPNSNAQFGLERPLNRIDVAVLLYRYMQYREGKRTQFLLTQSQENLILTLNALEKSDVKAAEHASARALLSARGAHLKSPDESLVKAVVKLAEGYRALVRAYQAGVAGKADETLKLSKDAWFLGDQARKLSPDVKQAAEQLQNYANTLAKSARIAG